MDIEAQKRAAAARAVEFVRSGMRIGLGTGSTARRFVELLGERVRGGLRGVGVPTSEATRRDAERFGVPLTLRRDQDGHAFVTDSGHWILDASLGRIVDPKGLGDRLAAIAGVVEHGLFVGLAQTAVIAGPSGVRVVKRP